MLRIHNLLVLIVGYATITYSHGADLQIILTDPMSSSSSSSNLNWSVSSNAKVFVASDTMNALDIECRASCPVEWFLEKFRYASFPDELSESITFETRRLIDPSNYLNTSGYRYTSKMLFRGKTKLLTGKYICQCTIEVEPKLNDSIYIYWEGSSSSYLIQSGQSFTVYKKQNDPWITLFCGVTQPGVRRSLFKQLDTSGEYDLLQVDNISLEVDIDGFHVNTERFPSPFGLYMCSVDSDPNSQLNANFDVRPGLDPGMKLKELSVSYYNLLSSQSENTIFFDKNDNTLICCSNGPNPVKGQVGFWCTNPQQCKFFHFRKQSGHNAKERNNTCSSYTMGKPLPPGAATFRCVTDGVAVSGELFISLDSETYFSVAEASPKNVVRVSQVGRTRNSNHIGASLNFTCQRTSYIFSEGIIWAGLFENGTSFLIYEGDTSPHADLYKVWKISHQKGDTWIELKILSLDVEYIACLAPVWDSTSWWRSPRLKLDLKESLVPTFTRYENPTVVYIDSADTELLIECKAFGNPMPGFTWSKDGRELLGAVPMNLTDGGVLSQLKVISKGPVESLLGTYICTAVNSIGSDSISISVQLFVSGKNLWTIIGISVGTILVFVIALFILVRIVIRQRNVIRYLTEAEIEEFEKGNPAALANWKDDINSGSHLLPYNTGYEVPPSNLIVDDSKILGQGTYGMVIQGTVIIIKGAEQEKVFVAVKMIKPNEDVQHFKALLSELKIMAYIGHHENVVSLIAACSRNIRNRELKIAIELCENGCLLNYLRHFRGVYKNTLPIDEEQLKKAIDNVYQPDYVNAPASIQHEYSNQATFNSKTLVNWCVQIATGMEFLTIKKVVHSDLAARNVLLTVDLRVKIGDFGLSKHLVEYSTYTKKTMALLPWKWMAIESLQDMEFSVSSDVWAYGVTIWEMFTLGQQPYPGMSWDNYFIKKLEDGYRLQQPHYATTEIYEVIISCMRTLRQSRPSFQVLKEWMSQIEDHLA